MHDLNFELSRICRHNRDGSYGTRDQRYKNLQHIANTLHELGFRHMRSTSLRHKHVVALIEHWLAQEISPRTIHNRMTFIRWWAEKVGKSQVLYSQNADYGIPAQSTEIRNKAQFLTEEEFLRIEDEFVRTSVRLQQAFGLRREESMKFRPSYADQGGFIRLKGTWTKGGRPREVPVIDKSQRELLELVRRFVGFGSLIPPDKLYKHQIGRYETIISKAGLHNLHGLRHGYAQRRYKTLTGWAAPLAGGPKFADLPIEEQHIDQVSRLKVSRELGHNRIEITRVYLG